jgi:hypothetical protein
MAALAGSPFADRRSRVGCSDLIKTTLNSTLQLQSYRFTA